MHVTVSHFNLVDSKISITFSYLLRDFRRHVLLAHSGVWILDRKPSVKELQVSRVLVTLCKISPVFLSVCMSHA